MSRVLVIGGGMAGLTAGLAAARSGAAVRVIERDALPGGSARWSMGRIWTLAEYAEFRRVVPLGDSQLQRRLVDEISAALEWLESEVGHLGPQASGSRGVGRIMNLGPSGDKSEYLSALADAAAGAGAKIHYESSPSAIERDDRGKFLATVVSTADSTFKFRFTADSIIFATGGFQGDREMRGAHIGPNARGMMVRSNPHSRGDGYKLGLLLGGVSSRGMSGFYGKSMPVFSEHLPPSQYKAATLDVARQATAVNLDGIRFTDEAAGIAGEGLANAGIQQRNNRYFLIIDSERTKLLPPGVIDAVSGHAGVHPSELLIDADSIEELAQLMEARWGVPQLAVLETVREVNAAFVANDGRRLSLPRVSAPSAIATGPFTAVACQAVITQPFGGLHVEDQMQMLNEDGLPLDGLFAAGADAGGVFLGNYAGGLAWALVSGRIAGVGAATSNITAHDTVTPKQANIFTLQED